MTIADPRIIGAIFEHLDTNAARVPPLTPS